MVCRNCGAQNQNGPRCAYCGQLLVQQAVPVNPYALTCEVCGSQNVTVQVVQENAKSVTKSRTRGKITQKKHGILWWVFIGSWWWIIDLLLWIFAFPVRFLVALFRKKKYKVKSTTTTVQNNKIAYIKICTCQNCGNVWRSKA